MAMVYLSIDTMNEEEICKKNTRLKKLSKLIK